VALIIFWVSLTLSWKTYANSSKRGLQLNRFGDKVSIYSEKAYRTNQGTYFEAVGNVVIKSGPDTLYGEKASFDIKKGLVSIEGNVRFISKDVTIYGSHIEFFSATGMLNMKNARIITNEFTIVAKELVRKAETLYDAIEAEFTTCRDCVESWTVSGKKLEIELNQYVHIQHAMIKAKGINVVYVPYIVLPIKNSRESGLLFPGISSRFDEGLAIQQPFYWAIDDSKDLTFTPSFWGIRGYGADMEYRQVFAQDMWVNYNHRLVNDKIYLPGKTSLNRSDTSYFRNFVNLESHLQWNNNITQHLYVNGTKDLDFVRDYPLYTDPLIQESDLGVTGFIEKRGEWFNLGLDGQYRRNMLVANSEEFDDNYVQVLPSVYLTTTPYTVFQSDRVMLQNISLGIDGDFTVFRQMKEDESTYLRNVRRVDARPYLNWQFFTLGPLSMQSRAVFDYQEYSFFDDDQENFQKYAANITTEFAFSMDKVFGLAYEENIPVNKLPKKNDEEKTGLDDKNSKQKTSKSNKGFAAQQTIGKLPDFESSLTEDTVRVVRNSYRHSQEFKFIHHFITAAGTNGNERFKNQIQTSEGWFDYRDGIQKDIANIGSNATRTIIPRSNSIEFQWNNLLIKKSAKNFNYFEDDRFLRDNFNYNRIGYFNISQGIVLDQDDAESLSDRLTRLFINTGYNATKWNINFSDYFFHDSGDHILNVGFQRRLNLFNFISAYSLNTFDAADIETVKVGMQLRPIDTFGISYLKEQDLAASENIRTIYQMDFMPNNNCWIFNINLTDSVVQKRYSMNFVFNFGNDDFKLYRTNFFSFDRFQ
jgi:LPS-assembly protein